MVCKYVVMVVCIVTVDHFILTPELQALCTPAGLYLEQHSLHLLCSCEKGYGKKQIILSDYYIFSINEERKAITHSHYLFYTMLEPSPIVTGNTGIPEELRSY